MVTNLWAYLAVGLFAGLFAGFFGLGGGIVLIPALVYFMHLSQHEAQGLSLAALLLPVGILAAWVYNKAHPIPIKPALFIACGIFIGGYFGGSLAQHVSTKEMRIAFGILLIATGLKTIFGR